MTSADLNPPDGEPPGASGLPDLRGLLEQAQLMQEQLANAQAELAQQRVTGDAGGGLVAATVNGSGELVGLSIAPAAVDSNDTETLADLVLAAYRDASQKASALQNEAMSPLADGLGGLGLPGT